MCNNVCNHLTNMGFPVAQMIKNLPPVMQGTGFNPWVRTIPGKGMATTPLFLPAEFYGWESDGLQSQIECWESEQVADEFTHVWRVFRRQK